MMNGRSRKRGTAAHQVGQERAMSKIIFCMQICLFASWPAVSASAQAPSSRPGSATAVVAGRVSIGGGPARRVALVLIPKMGGDPNPGLVRRAKSDSDGRFRFGNVPAGKYLLQPLAPGFVFSDAKVYPPRGTMVQVAEGQVIDNLQIDLKRGGVIAGRVTDANGKPMAERLITIKLLIRKGQSQILSYPNTNEMNQTDDRGEYRIY